MDSLAVRVEHVTKAFDGGWSLFRSFRRKNGAARGPLRALDDVSFEVRRGEIYGIIGANGSGKSTLIRILSTLLLPDGGSVRVFGHDVQREATRVRTLINRVSADPSFFRSMSARENLLFFGRVYGLTAGEVARRTEEIFERLGFSVDLASEPMSHLSRGQQQKVAVARSFLTSPVLMLLDEPTTGLDPRSKRDVQAFVREVRERHDATVLLTTHDMEEAELLCDRIAFLAGGRIVVEGTPMALRRSVADARREPVERVTMEAVFMELTGRSIEEDETPVEVAAHG
ncbi:MAG TPA: ABC transporter ATP-binding protein [Dehalococcoidia bacterium]|nr:ABC transporter ATP-binding protein [Dehalococcoidia bacterium]